LKGNCQLLFKNSFKTATTKIQDDKKKPRISKDQILTSHGACLSLEKSDSLLLQQGDPGSNDSTCLNKVNSVKASSDKCTSDAHDNTKDSEESGKVNFEKLRRDDVSTITQQPTSCRSGEEKERFVVLLF